MCAATSDAQYDADRQFSTMVLGALGMKCAALAGDQLDIIRGGAPDLNRLGGSDHCVNGTALTRVRTSEPRRPDVRTRRSGHGVRFAYMSGMYSSSGIGPRR